MCASRRVTQSRRRRRVRVGRSAELPLQSCRATCRSGSSVRKPPKSCRQNVVGRQRGQDRQTPGRARPQTCPQGLEGWLESEANVSTLHKLTRKVALRESSSCHTAGHDSRARSLVTTTHHPSGPISLTSTKDSSDLGADTDRKVGTPGSLQGLPITVDPCPERHHGQANPGQPRCPLPPVQAQTISPQLRQISEHDDHQVYYVGHLGGLPLAGLQRSRECQEVLVDECL